MINDVTDNKRYRESNHQHGKWRLNPINVFCNVPKHDWMNQIKGITYLAKVRHKPILFHSSHKQKAHCKDNANQ